MCGHLRQGDGRRGIRYFQVHHRGGGDIAGVGRADGDTAGARAGAHVIHALDGGRHSIGWASERHHAQGVDAVSHAGRGERSGRGCEASAGGAQTDDERVVVGVGNDQIAQRSRNTSTQHRQGLDRRGDGHGNAGRVVGLDLQNAVGESPGRGLASEAAHQLDQSILARSSEPLNAQIAAIGIGDEMDLLFGQTSDVFQIELVTHMQVGDGVCTGQCRARVTRLEDEGDIAGAASQCVSPFAALNHIVATATDQGVRLIRTHEGVLVRGTRDIDLVGVARGIEVQVGGEQSRTRDLDVIGKRS